MLEKRKLRPLPWWNRRGSYWYTTGRAPTQLAEVLRRMSMKLDIGHELQMKIAKEFAERHQAHIVFQFSRVWEARIWIQGYQIDRFFIRSEIDLELEFPKGNCLFCDCYVWTHRDVCSKHLCRKLDYYWRRCGHTPPVNVRKYRGTKEYGVLLMAEYLERSTHGSKKDRETFFKRIPARKDQRRAA